MLAASETTNVRTLGALAVMVSALLISACANPLSAEARSESSTDQFCETVLEGDAQLERTFASEPTDEQVKDLNQLYREVRDLLPTDAPPEIDEFLAIQMEMSDNGVAGLFERPDGYTDALAEEHSTIFDDYIADTCDPDASNASAPSTPTDGSTEGSTTVESIGSATLLPDGPTGNYEEVTVDIGKVHTTADPVGFLTGGPEEPSEQEHLLVEVGLASQIDESNQFQAQDFKLQLPDGTVVAATSLLDSNGKSAPPSLKGKDSASTIAVFETDSAITSLSNLSVGIDREDHVPLYLPLEGNAESSYPISLEAGQSAQIAGKHPVDICDTLFATKVKSADVQLETFADVSAGVTGRADREKRFVAITLEMKNVTEVEEDTASRRQSCGSYSGQLIKTNIRLLVDDKPTSNQTASFRWPTIAIDSAEDIELVYEIPLETAEVTLIGHKDDDVIASWNLTLPQVAGEA